MKRITYFLLVPLIQSAYAGSFVIEGVSGKPLSNLERRLEELEQEKPLESLTTEELTTQVKSALEPFGYLKAQVLTRIINSKKAHISISLGPLTYIQKVSVQLTGDGARNSILEKKRLSIPLKVNTPFLTAEYNKSKQMLSSTAEQLGYLHGSFSTARVLITKNNTAEIQLVFDTGPLFYFGQTQFNPTTINPELLHRFVPFHPGRTYSTDLILKLNNDLANSGYFNSVLVKPRIGETQTVPIDVHLEPVSKYSYSLGAGYGTDTGIRGRAGLFVTPVNPLGHKFSAIAQGSFTQNALQAQYLIPGANPVVDQYSLTGNFSNLNYDTGYSNAYLFSLAQQHHNNSFKRVLSINALYETFNYSLQPHQDQLLPYPKAKFSFSKTTSPLFSPTGFTLTLNALGASTALLSKISFAQASVDAKAAYMFNPLRLRFYGHAIQGVTAISDINQLPLSLALLLGGMDNLKAFSFNSIGPGKIISYGGLEVQKEVVKNWYLLAFYDAGDVYKPSIKATLYDVGAGLMWVSPVGPIKLGLAQEVSSSLQRIGTNPRLVISMGPDL
jgi:translocation and assembly module TamA